jgi:CelD/BcsL family acetyltransferase involved in cellulose biosynthesis
MTAQTLQPSPPQSSTTILTASQARPALGVRLVSDIGDFTALHDAWNALAAASRRASVFLQHEWFDAAWQWRGQAARLYLLCLTRGRELLAVMPLVHEDRASRGRRLRELSFLTVPDTQACDVIVGEADEAIAAEAFSAELARRTHEWDVLRLKYLPPESVAASSLREALTGRGFVTRLEQRGANPCVCLDSTWSAYYATRTRSLKKANNLAANRLKKAGDIRIDWFEPGATAADELARVLDQIIAVSAASWKRRTGNSLDNPGPQAFIRRLSRAARERAWLSVWTLSLNGRPVAMEYQLVADGRVFALRSDFDEAFEEISPGSHLSRCLLERLFGRGLERYYMGPGDNPYKERWAEQAEPVAELAVYGRTLRGRWLAAWETTLKPLARRLRDRITGMGRPEHGPEDR